MKSANSLKIVRFYSSQELRTKADYWDDLWYRSEVCTPRLRAKLIALWLDTFAKNNFFQAIAVEQSGKLVAALPIVSMRIKGLVKVGGFPSNNWASCGDFLVDPDCDMDNVISLLVSGLKQLPIQLLWFENVAINEPRWIKLLKVVEESRLLFDVREQYRVGRVKIIEDWPSYFAKLSKNHRHNRRKQAKMLEQEGGAQLLVRSSLNPSEVVPILKLGLEVEDRSWKGEMGSSVLRSPGMFHFFCQEATYLADQGQLELIFLNHKNKPIAFIYAYRSKNVCFTPKVGYDNVFKKFGPGQQLMMMYLKFLSNEQHPNVLDFSGPLATWTENWATDWYHMGRVVVSTGSLLSTALFRTYILIIDKLRTT